MDTSKKEITSDKVFKNDLLTAFHFVHGLILRYDVDEIDKDILTGIMGSLFLLSRRY